MTVNNYALALNYTWVVKKDWNNFAVTFLFLKNKRLLEKFELSCDTEICFSITWKHRQTVRYDSRKVIELHSMQADLIFLYILLCLYTRLQTQVRDISRVKSVKWSYNDLLVWFQNHLTCFKENENDLRLI